MSEQLGGVQLPARLNPNTGVNDSLKIYLQKMCVYRWQLLVVTALLSVLFSTCRHEALFVDEM